MARNLGWYNLNEQRPWPLDDAATLIDDAGQRLPHDILADIQLRFPSILGDEVLLSSLTVGPNIVTATFLAASSVYTPVASISLPRPVDIYRHYALESIYPGVSGWIVFGNGIETEHLKSYRFSTLAQSRLQFRSASKYFPAPLTSLGTLNNQASLTGLVRLSAGNDIEIVKEDREIEGVIHEAVVIRLKPDTDQGERNIYEDYAGPCGKRPESRNCGSPEPIEFINNVGPDCCGNLTFEFRGCVAISKDIDNCNIVLDCGFGLGEACPTADRLPDATGKLPNEYDDLCASLVDISIDLSDDPSEVPTFEELVSGAGDVLASLPVTINFEDTTTGDMDLIRGSVVVAADAELGQSAFFSDGGGVNLLLFNSDSPTGEPSWTTFYKRITTTCRIRSGDIGALHNAGVVLNYRTTPDSPTTYNYWLVDITWDDYKQMRVRWFNGSTFISLAEIALTGLTIDNRYTLDVTVLPVSTLSDAAWITATVTGLDDAVLSTIGPVYTPNYRAAEGTVGLFSNRSATEYSTITLANNPIT
jgi:hypothetical protein